MMAHTPATEVAPSAANARRFDLVAAIALSCATLIAYFPALGGGFLMDDLTNFTRPELSGVRGLGRIWFELGATQQYYPVLHSAFWVQRTLFGETTIGYHLVNVALHLGAAFLVVALMRRLRLPGGWLAALLFALHPLAVDSVAWISEQKNTLSTFCFLTAALAYFRFDDTRHRRTYWLACGWFALAVLSKTPAATLPAALLVIQWWRHGRLEMRRDVRPLAPWFAFGAGFAAITVWVERMFIGAHGDDFALGFVERALIAGRAFWFYAEKLFWPVDLLFMYPRWTMSSADATQWALLMGVAATGGALVWLARRWRGPLAAFLLFGGTLFPALGFVDIYWFAFSYVADHFAYLSSLALIVPLAAVLARAFGQRRVVALMGIAALVAILGTLTWRHSHVYRDYPTLNRETLARNPGAWLLQNNLGVEAAQKGRIDEALGYFETAVRLRPGFPEGHYNLARAYELSPGKNDAAIESYRTALRLQPRYADAHVNLGALLANQGQLPEALEHFAAVTRLRPKDTDAWMKLGLALEATDGREREALPCFETALRLQPESFDARLHYALSLANASRMAEAVVELETLVRQQPEHAEANQLLQQVRAAMRN